MIIIFFECHTCEPEKRQIQGLYGVVIDNASYKEAVDANQSKSFAGDHCLKQVNLAE